MTSTVLPPATANVPMVRAMFPVPMMVMLPMSCALFLFSRFCCVSFVPGRAQRRSRSVPCGDWVVAGGYPRYSGVWSDGGGAAVGDQFQAVDVAGVVGGEEQGDGGDFFGAAHLSAGDQGLECGHGGLVEQFFLFGGGDLAGGEDVDPDLAVAQFVEPDAGPGLLDGFASGVEAPAGESAE